jgi:hypothetical protein
MRFRYNGLDRARRLARFGLGGHHLQDCRWRRASGSGALGCARSPTTISRLSFE